MLKSGTKMARRLVLRYEWIILAGLVTAIWAGLNVVGVTNTDSDIFWALFGVAAAIEGIIELWYGRYENDEG